MSVAPDRRVFLVNVAELLRRPGNHRRVEFIAPVNGLAVVDSRVPDGALAEVDVHLESLADAVTVTGTVAAPWEGLCRRCLDTARGRLEAAVSEVYSPHPAGEEIWPITGDQLDLQPLVVDALTLELPLAPLCRPDCAGLCPVCGANLNEGDCRHGGPPIDPRWHALEGYEFPGEGTER